MKRYDWTIVDTTIRQLRERGKTYSSIAGALARQGVRTPYGRTPNTSFVCNVTTSPRYKSVTKARNTALNDVAYVQVSQADLVAAAEEKMVKELISAPLSATKRLNAIRAVLL